MEHKEKLRQQLRHRLACLDPATAESAAESVAQHVLELPEILDARGVLCCLSFGTEIDTWPLVDHLRASGKDVYVPRTVPRTKTLSLHSYPCELKTLSFGLQEPVRQAPSLADDDIATAVDVALILGLGFDQQGIRLGYGGGYFDRFLARHPMTAVGLAYELQIEEALPRQPHDLPMDVVVTEAGVWRRG